MKKIAVLGAGLVGNFIAETLAKDYIVDAFDAKRKTEKSSIDNLNYIVAFFPEDVNKLRLFNKYDLVVNAVSGEYGYKTLKELINLKYNIVDFSFMPEDPMELDSLAKDNQVTAVIDFGFAPGISHMMVKRDELELDNIIKSDIYVGGIQKDRGDYKAVFSPRDVVEEYSRPARYINNGKILKEEPFIEYYGHFDYSCFISDGLRTLLKTTKIPNLAEYTMREGIHWTKMAFLKEDGFFDPENTETTAKILAKKWKFDPDKDRDMSILHIYSENKKKKFVHMLFDSYDEKNGVHSMARTTGLPVIAMVKEILENKYNRTGILPPEYIAEDIDIYQRIIKYLVDNGIKITKKVEYL